MMEIEVEESDLRRSRKPNFSDDEILTLIEEVSKEKSIIVPNTQSGTHGIFAKKSMVWKRICFKMNAMFGNERTITEIRKKWKDLKSLARLASTQTRIKLPKRRQSHVRQVMQVIGIHASDIQMSDDESTNEATQTGSYSPPYLGTSVYKENGNEVENRVIKSDLSVSSDHMVGLPHIQLQSNDETVSGATNESDSHPNQSDLKISANESESLFHSISSNRKMSVPTSQRSHPSRPNQSRLSSTNSKKSLSKQQQLNALGNNLMHSLRAKKMQLKIRWLESEIAKNDSIVELNRIQADYVRAKRAKLDI